MSCEKPEYNPEIEAELDIIRAQKQYRIDQRLETGPERMVRALVGGAASAIDGIREITGLCEAEAIGKPANTPEAPVIEADKPR